MRPHPNRHIAACIGAACLVAIGPVRAAPQTATAARDAFVLLDASTVPTKRGGIVPVALSFANGTASDVDVVGVRSPTSESVAWHEAAWPDGVARIGCSIRFRLPAHETRRLRPPGPSLVLVGVTRALAVGDTIPIDLALVDKPTIRLLVPVRTAPPLPAAPWQLTARCAERPAGTPVVARARGDRGPVVRFVADRQNVVSAYREPDQAAARAPAATTRPAAGELEVGSRAERLYESVMSPYCPELTLASCPSDGATALRAEVRQQLIAGWSDAAILASLHERFGSVLDGAPAPRGLGALAWILPFAVLMLGGVGVAAWIRHDARRGAYPHSAGEPAPGGAVAATNADAVLHARLEALVRSERE